MSNGGKISFGDFFSKGQYETLAETIAIPKNKKSLSIGILKEVSICEQRVALVPNSIRVLCGYDFNILVESGAGEMSNFKDGDYSEAGAQVSSNTELILKSNLIIKIAPPTIEELKLMPGNQILFSPLHLPLVSREYLDLLIQKKITAIAMENIREEDGSFPIVRIMSEIAGMSAMLTAGELLSNSKGGRGVLLGGVSGVPPAKVVILGAGVVGEFAIKTALGLGASIRVFDNNISKLMRLQSKVGRQLHTSAINPVYLAYQLTSADVVIGAMHSKNGRSPMIVTDEMVSKMKDGSVIVDVSIDQGGCIETSQVTTLNKPTFVKHGVIHYCVPNIASHVSRTSSIAVSNILTPIVVKMGEYFNIENILFHSAGIRNGCYTFKGRLTNEYLAQKFELKYTNLELILTSDS